MKGRLERRGDDARGGNPGVLATGPPVALTPVGGDASDTISQLGAGMAHGSRLLLVLLPLASLGKSHGRDSSLKGANLAPPVRRSPIVQEGSMLSHTSPGRAVASNVRAPGDDHALCAKTQRASAAPRSSGGSDADATS